MCARWVGGAGRRGQAFRVRRGAIFCGFSVRGQAGGEAGTDADDELPLPSGLTGRRLRAIRRDRRTGRRGRPQTRRRTGGSTRREGRTAGRGSCGGSQDLVWLSGAPPTSATRSRWPAGLTRASRSEKQGGMTEALFEETPELAARTGTAASTADRSRRVYGTTTAPSIEPRELWKEEKKEPG